MTSAHVIFIPAILLVGFVLGFVIGRKTLIAQLEAAKENLRKRKERRQAAQAEDAVLPPPDL